jgi:DNA-binding response OmpR family regulator
MLTSRSEEYDKLLGFHLGADDYIPKPFSPKELMARIGAILKRSGNKSSDKLSFDEFCISPGARVVTVGDKELNLPPKEFDLLLYLAQNERLVLSREQLLNRVWGYDYYGDVRTLDTHIKSLREHLGEYRKLIQTAWGVGYKFEYK